MAWTPYALVTFYAAFIGEITTPLIGTIPAMFAKSSFVWSSLVFIYSSEHTKKVIRSIFTTQVDGEQSEGTTMMRKMSNTRPRSTSAVSNPSSQ